MDFVVMGLQTDHKRHELSKPQQPSTLEFTISLNDYQ